LGLIGWGVLLVLIGLVLTFSNLLGFVPGVPLFLVGAVLIVLGVVVALLSLPFRGARALSRRRA